jgi:hypothetical protein
LGFGHEDFGLFLLILDALFEGLCFGESVFCLLSLGFGLLSNVFDFSFGLFDGFECGFGGLLGFEGFCFGLGGLCFFGWCFFACVFEGWFGFFDVGADVVGGIFFFAKGCELFFALGELVLESLDFLVEAFAFALEARGFFFEVSLALSYLLRFFGEDLGFFLEGAEVLSRLLDFLFDVFAAFDFGFGLGLLGF